MRKKEEDQGAKLIRCGMGLLLGGVLALTIMLAACAVLAVRQRLGL